MLAKLLGLPESAIRMVENDVGGGFGARGEFYPEDFLIPFAARLTGRPVKWIEDRREHLLATNHARDAECELEIACDRDGTILGAARPRLHRSGAYIRTNGPTAARNIAQVLTGPYRIPHVRIDVDADDDQQDAVGNLSRARAASRPISSASGCSTSRPRDLGIDRVEFRRRNLVAEAEMPYPLPPSRRSTSRRESDSGDYAMTLDALPRGVRLERKGGAAGQADRRPLPRHRASAATSKAARSGPKESARLVLEADGTVSVYVGSSSVGQGLETVCAQIAADALELPMDDITACSTARPTM